MFPVLNNVKMVDVREQKYETVNDDGEPILFTQTRDVLEVPMNVAVNYRINPDQAADLFKEVGLDYEARLIWPAVRGIATIEVGKVDAVALPQERNELAQAILGGLEARLAPAGIVVTSVAIQDTQFPGEYTAAVLAKEVAEEKAIESQRLVAVATNEAEQARQRAAGNADALRLEAEAKNDEQELLGMSPTEYVWFKTWNGILPSTLLGESGDFIVDLPGRVNESSSTDSD